MKFPTSHFRSLLLALLAGAGSAWAQAALPDVEVFKSPYCGCCEEWIKHLRQNGFSVTSRNVNDVPAARQQLGMPNELGSCHTAKVGGYLVEGHVPAADIRRLLKEKPKAIGLAVPGMPVGSPGMETGKPMAYDTLLVHTDRSTRVFAHH